RSNDTVRRDAELAPDVILDLDGRRRRQSEHALGAAGSCERCELEVIGPKVVPPLRDAMNLIDGEERHALIEERLSETLVQEALRRDVEDAKAVLAKAGVDLSGLGDGQGRIEARDGDAPTRERLLLVDHERGQRRDDEREPFEEKRGKLIAERLPTSRRKDRKRRAASEEVLDDRALSRKEIVVRECVAKDL